MDDLANALAEHPLLDVTDPVEVTLAGFDGKYVDLQVPSDISRCSAYVPWDRGIYAQGPGHRWHLWILDVERVRVVIQATDYAGTSAEHQAELHAIVNSIQITGAPLPAIPSPDPSGTSLATPIPSGALVVLRPPERGAIEPGRYWLMGPGFDKNPPGWPSQISVAIPTGWTQNPGTHGGGIQSHEGSPMFSSQKDGARLSGWSVANLYDYSCGNPTPADPPLGPTVDDLVSGLAFMSRVEVTEAADVTVDGFSGKRMLLTTISDCGVSAHPAPGPIRVPIILWSSAPEDWGEYWTNRSDLRWQHELWILDVDGLRFVIDAAHAPDAAPELVAELQQMVESIDIQP